MSVSPGTRVGHYDVTSLLGEGGMGQVWQATDTQLNRQVALKILPDAFVDDPDRLARFQREAQVLASLNHPGIAQIYGIEEDEAEGRRALVLELVEGPTLADRIAQGAIPIEDALPIATQIAEALEAAHEAGVIHRDLKPANIKVRSDGTVKVLDFGLAKALDTAPEGDPSQSPTLTAAATQMGVIMGTAAYMSPEQARAKPVDKRADIWALGVVLVEMLTGRKVFDGEDVSMTLSSVLQREPDWSHLPPGLSPSLAVFLRRCLEKDPRQRVHDVADVRLAIDGAFETGATLPLASEAAVQLQVWQRPVVVAGMVAAAVLITTLAVATMMRPAPTSPPDLVQFAILPDSPSFARSPFERDIAISPDGTQVVYQGDGAGGGQLWVHRLDQLESAPLRGSEAGTGPFLSPDGEWVGFLQGGPATLMKVSVLGGPPVMLAESPSPIRGASWGADDQIVLGTADGLMRVAGSGGEVETLTAVDREQGETAHSWPFVIPGREAVLFVISAGPPLTTGQLAVLDLTTGNLTRLGLAGVSPHYASTGHLVYAAQDGALHVVPFDAASLDVTGNPVPLVEGVVVKNTTGAANFSVSDTGSLAYISGRTTFGDRTLALMGRDGAVEPLDVPPAAYISPRLSPDGGKLVVQTAEDDGNVLWLYDLTGNTQIQQLTFEGDNQRPVWTPDGAGITFSSDRDGTMSLYGMPTGGNGAAERLTTADPGTFHWPASWSPDGQTLLFSVEGDRTDWDVWTLSADGGETTRLYDAPDTLFWGPEVSPDGRWLAYARGVAGEGMDVFVEPFPPTGSRRRISQTGAVWPLWSPNGDRLFFRDGAAPGSRRLRSVEVVTEPDFAFRNEETLPIGRFTVVPFHRSYDITPDGERFLMVLPVDQSDVDEAASSQINMVLNWHSELLERVPLR